MANYHWFARTSFSETSSTIINVCGADCDRTSLAGLVLATAGSLVLVMVLVVDVLIPLHRDKPLTPWLKAMALIPIPYILFRAANAVWF
ncbi:hypothetical protein ABZS76_02705 [Streptomyces sp. NPDC005562]|uniref:hypothetical protein n=1 Tax=Streptomyces sp. NPDC005562 TaxID=3154890 RepID=UPI0033B054F3